MDFNAILRRIHAELAFVESQLAIKPTPMLRRQHSAALAELDKVEWDLWRKHH